MKTKLITMAGIACGLLFSLTAWSDAPPGVGSADLSSTPCYGIIVVGPPGNFYPTLPGGYGGLFVELGKGKVVESNSAQGNVHLSCHGRIEQGEAIFGLRAPNDFGWGTAATTEEACAALAAGGLDGSCRGNGKKSAIILNTEFNGESCTIPLAEGGSIETYDWMAVKTSNGKVMITCHGND